MIILIKGYWEPDRSQIFMTKYYIKIKKAEKYKKITWLTRTR
jgi:hypothetical protein